MPSRARTDKTGNRNGQQFNPGQPTDASPASNKAAAEGSNRVAVRATAITANTRAGGGGGGDGTGRGSFYTGNNTPAARGNSSLRRAMPRASCSTPSAPSISRCVRCGNCARWSATIRRLRRKWNAPHAADAESLSEPLPRQSRVGRADAPRSAERCRPARNPTAARQRYRRAHRQGRCDSIGLPGAGGGVLLLLEQEAIAALGNGTVGTGTV